jgi:hypothetical protein
MTTLALPVPYTPFVEHADSDEAEQGAELNATLREILDKTFADYGHAVRSVHAKSHGLLHGKVTVLENKRPELAQGLFAKAASYEAILRLSTIPGDILHDDVSVPRGLAIKVLNVPGARLAGSEDATTQDFLLVNGPAFGSPNAKPFLRALKLLAASTDKAEGAKKVFSAALRGLESVVEAAGGKSATLMTLGGHPRTNILGETFYSQVPCRYGDYMAKVCVAPASAELLALKNKPLAAHGHDAIRDAVVEHFAKAGAAWELRVQLCRDLESMPVEDAAKVWPEDQSPYMTVARIDVPPQTGWNAELSREIDDGMSFSPWHGLEAHRPLGSVMRLRKAAYEMSAAFRSQRNVCPVHELGSHK